MIIVGQTGTQLRAYEEEMLRKHFDDIRITSCDGVWNVFVANECKPTHVYWRPDSERTNKKQFQQYCLQEMRMKEHGVKFINSMFGFPKIQSKERAFSVWEKNNIRCPRWFGYFGKDDYWEKATKYLMTDGVMRPHLIRLNNSVTGDETEFIQSHMTRDEILCAVGRIEDARLNPKYGGGIDCRTIATDFIETRNDAGFRYSFRIIVAGDNIVTGYARMAKGDDWCVITKKWSPEMAEEWVRANEMCQDFCCACAKDIVKAVKCLGLDFVGVDVIIGQDRKAYFLEVQSGFSVGYLNHPNWKPPFFNPCRPQVLVDFLINNMDDLKKRIPMYCDLWLDKKRMFDEAFNSLKNST